MTTPHHPLVLHIWNLFPLNYIFGLTNWIPNLLLLPFTFLSWPFVAAWNFLPEMIIAVVVGTYLSLYPLSFAVYIVFSCVCVFAGPVGLYVWIGISFLYVLILNWPITLTAYFVIIAYYS